MSIRVALRHRTAYHYDEAVRLSPQTIRLRPAPHCRTPVLNYSLKVEPSGHFINWQLDPNGNYLARLVFPDRTRVLSIDVSLTAELTVINPFDFFLEEEANDFPFQYEKWLAAELRPFLEAQPAGPLLGEYLSNIDRSPCRTVDFLVALNQRLHQDVRYVIRMEPGVQTPEETLSRRSGSCRDSAWLLVQILRRLGLAARFVSGYLIQLRPDVKPLTGPAGAEHDFTDLHAWTEVYLPGAGWVGLDPTSGLLAAEGHLPLACTPDPQSAAPLTGTTSPSKSHFEFSMSVERIHEDRRVTLPYTDDQWGQISKLGHQIDALLEQRSVRLTMGGEPTFVSAEDMEGAEWNFDALGAKKRQLGGELLRRLREKFSTGGLLHFGQGKQYPGEPLPRWALSCHWRRDGEPIWKNPELIADETVNYGLGIAEALRFMTALTHKLELDANFVLTAYEDCWQYLFRERRLPVNVDPFDSRLEDPQERARLAKVFEQGLHAEVGYALPLRCAGRQPRCTWQSGPWFLRRERLYLIPGDSPLGYRLPLDSLPWQAESDRQEVVAADPMMLHPPLSAQTARLQSHDSLAGAGTVAAFQPSHFRRTYEEANRGGEGNGMATVHKRATVASASKSGYSTGEADDGDGRGQDFPREHAIPGQGESHATLVRTALCVEPREGRLYVFLPPLAQAEEFIDLVQCIEAVAEELKMPVLLEGYPPPRDYRMTHFSITPDPGVLEVNIQPAVNWEELVRNTTILYEEARQCRLGTEKFMIDGKHVGTGGGNHIVMGGPRPVDSPFLRRPDVLRSLLAYWNNHPSLSYLFSGTFVGPTSQAPRVDEARHEALYELDIAFKQIPDGGGCPPWIVDRVFRHLLTDATGNTHRAEFCIDKLFSPDSSQGRAGLVEMRSFEMPPHARMSLTQQLLLRACVAWFWEHPYRQPLVRWGTTLHDRFMMPEFVWQDIRDVIGDLNRAGYAFQLAWFDPHFEFRFPRCGEVVYDGVRLELRSAIEPWHVLGEENAPAGTTRYVDSSLERVQVKVQGMTERRHAILCNGQWVPLHPTGTQGEFVAGVRFRAWRPPSCLHPTIGVHSPLVFDLYDRWQERSLGGCTWHVAHPGGRSFETFPVNAYEAESRRIARFQPWGHTGGVFPPPPRCIDRDYPLTLDLRRG